MSTTGLFIISASLPKLDTRLHIQLFVEPERCLFFEGEVRRHKLVPAELRTIERGGFGVRLLSPREVLTSALDQEMRIPHFELSYATRAAFQQATSGSCAWGRSSSPPPSSCPGTRTSS